MSTSKEFHNAGAATEKALLLAPTKLTLFRAGGGGTPSNDLRGRDGSYGKREILRCPDPNPFSVFSNFVHDTKLVHETQFL